MKKQEFLKRCETIYDMGLATDEVLSLLSRWTDAMLRLQGGQIDSFISTMEEERQRTNRFSGGETLANDVVGYKVIQLCAVFKHNCQKCAEDKNAWHTRPAFCNHRVL